MYSILINYINLPTPIRKDRMKDLVSENHEMRSAMRDLSFKVITGGGPCQDPVSHKQVHGV